MNIITCQDDFIMTGVAMIELDATEIQFENGRYHQIWHFDSKEEAEEAFTEVWREIKSSVRDDGDCFLDEALIKAQVEVRLK